MKIHKYLSFLSFLILQKNIGKKTKLVDVGIINFENDDKIFEEFSTETSESVTENDLNTTEIFSSPRPTPDDDDINNFPEQ